ncbi:MAG: LuxR C-terminal-related transcriptional regulator [Slackia sp.]
MTPAISSHGDAAFENVEHRGGGTMTETLRKTTPHISVAEELSISQTTAHTHIGRIYAKTGLHSRQEILDYVRNHVD